MSISISRPALTLFVVAIALISSATAMAAQADAPTIYACVKKKTGTPRFVSKASKCRKGETKLSWNGQGLTGATGLTAAQGPAGAPGAAGAQGIQGEAGPGAKVVRLDTASSNPETQSLFTYGGDSIGATCGSEGNPSYAAFDIRGDNVEVFGDASAEVYEGAPNFIGGPGFNFVAPGASYTNFDSLSFTAKAGYFAAASSHLMLIEMGAGAVDFHVDLTFEVKDVSSSYSECKFAAVYYPVATG